jgi:hypothetical protein
VPGPVRDRRVSLTWPRLPAAAEVAIVAAGYAGYALVRLAVRASRPAAIAHAAGLWRTERWLHVDIEPSLNHLAAARPVLAETTGYYYGLAHFTVTPLVLAWLWLRRPAAFGPLRSALVLATTAANVVFWTWPAAPPRFAVPGMTNVLVRYRILGAGDARLVPLPGGLGGVEGGVLGALALTGTQPATALTAVIVYRVAGHWAPGAAGAVTAALLTRRHPAQAARPVTPLRPQAPRRRPPGSRPAHGGRHPRRRPRSQSPLPPGPEGGNRHVRAHR